MKIIQKSIILTILFLVTLILSTINATDIHNITSDMNRDHI